MGVNPARHREQLIRGLDDEGLEELTLRYVRREYPDAHRTRRGVDGGIDVLSDYGQTPARAWQCKTAADGKADWGECRKSIKAAAAEDGAPIRYTFVFNFVLSAGQREFWRKTLLTELRRNYPGFEVIDYVDDLHNRVGERPELVSRLEDGAYGSYIRQTLAETAQTGVNPMANAVDLGEGLEGVAERARAAGRNDPRFAYGFTGREAAAGDEDIKKQAVRFTMASGQQDQLPTFTITVRQDDMVEEVSARPRSGVEITAPQPWFADTEEGVRARAIARTELAKGRAVVLGGEHVGLSAGDIPDSFADWTDLSRPSARGQLELGTSLPLTLTVTLDANFGRTEQEVTMYRVPAEPGADVAYAGSVGGAVIAIDLSSVAAPPEDDEESWVECAISVTLAIEGESSETALRGLGFAKAFGETEHVHLSCPGLLPQGGYVLDGAQTLDGEEADTWEAAAVLALAFDGLTRRDGVLRTMPSELGPAQVVRAEMVLHLLRDGSFEVQAEDGKFRVPLPAQARPGDDPQIWRLFSAELPSLAGVRTGLIVEQEVRGAELLRVEQDQRGSMALICSGRDGQGSIVMRLQGSA